MSIIDFNSNLDKITEQEVVYDFFSRLLIGHDLKDLDNSNNVIFNSGYNVKNILAKTIMALPTSIALNLADIKTTYITIDPASTSTTISITLSTESTLVLAYAERSRVDLSSLFTTEDNKTFTLNLDIPYKNKEIIKFYYLLGVTSPNENEGPINPELPIGPDGPEGPIENPGYEED